MAKSKKTNVGMFITLGAIVLALVAFFLMFAPAVGGKNTNSTFTGAQIAFGYKEENTGVAILSFSFMNFLPYLLILIGLVFSVLALFGKLSFISKIVSAGCYIAAGVFFFCAVQFTLPANIESDKLVQVFRDALTLNAGVIVSGVLSFLAGLAAVSTIFVKK